MNGNGPMAAIGMLVANPSPTEVTMTRVDDMRKALEATIGNLTPARAQELAKGFLEPGAAKEQVAKTAADMMEWSQRNRQRLRSGIQDEIKVQMRQMGVATQDELDALRKRVRELERAAGMTASGRKRTAAKKTPAKRASTRKSAAKKTTTSGNS
jgi:polyhydroxyalkanoate synthesis regulator phasin